MNEDVLVYGFHFHKQRALVGDFGNYRKKSVHYITNIIQEMEGESRPGHKCEASATVCTRPNSKLMR